MQDLEMCLYVMVARALTTRCTPAQTLRWAAVVRRALLKRADAPPRSGARAEQLAWRWVKLRGGDCYDRAVAASWWLARRGEGVEVVIGMRQGAQGVEGHAWLARASGEALLVEPGAGYREVTRG